MADTDGIKHTTLKINNIKMHIAEKGSGPMILFVHGFPELWYSWRHQILALSDLGFRCVAPDMRGYGDTEAPSDFSKYTYFHTVGDLVALIEALGEDKVFVVGHDWGAAVAWHLCLLRPDRVKALVNLSVPYRGRNPDLSPITALKAGYGDDFYMCRFQVHGEMEREIDEVGGAEKFLGIIFPYRTPAPIFLRKGHWHKEVPPLPTWMSQQDFAYYVSKFNDKGLTGGLNYYRAMDLNWQLLAPWTGAKILVPTKFVIGDLDAMPGAQDYITKGGMKKDVPLLKEVVVLQGVSHFLQQETPDEINNHIYDFLQQY